MTELVASGKRIISFWCGERGEGKGFVLLFSLKSDFFFIVFEMRRQLSKILECFVGAGILSDFLMLNMFIKQKTTTCCLFFQAKPVL